MTPIVFTVLATMVAVFTLCVVELFQRTKHHREEILNIKDNTANISRSLYQVREASEERDFKTRQKVMDQISALKAENKVTVLVKLNGTSNNYDYQELDVATLVGLLMRDKEIIEQDMYVLRGHKDE